MRKQIYRKFFAVTALLTLVFVFLPISTPTVQTQLTPSSLLPSPQKALVTVSFSPKINLAEASGTTAQPGTTNDAFSCSIISNSIATCAIYLIAQAIVWILKLFISLGALLVQVGLQVNQHLFDAPIVTTGFSVSLAIANLGFVLGIIIIALATILRNQSYGAKQLLWKLVVMAILVNFGLVITRPIVAFADGLTNYFMGQISGASGDATAFTGNLVNAFAPQTLNEAVVMNPQQITQDAICAGAGANPMFGGGAAALCHLATGIWNFVSTNQSDTFVRVFLASIFAICLAALIAFVLIVLSILLLVRYVYLGILLVLLPFAWLMWIFPKFSGEFHKWWNNFIKWTFFPTCALFFIYLVLATITSTAYQNSALTVANSQVQASQQAAGGIFTMTGLIGLIQQFADEFVMAGLLLGGLFAAQSLAGKAGGMVVEGGKSATKWAAGKAGGAAARQGKKAASRAVPEGVKQKLQSGGYRFVPKRLQVAAGIGLGNVQKAGGAALIDQEATWAKQHSADPEEAKRLLASGGIKEQRKIALLQQLSSQGRLSDDVKVGGQSLSEFSDANEDRLNKNLGQGKLVKDIDKTLGSNKEMRTAAKADQSVPANKKALDDASDKFFGSLTKGDVSKTMNVDAVFGGDMENPIDAKNTLTMVKAQMRAIANRGQDLIPSILSKANGKTGNNIRKPYKKILDEVVAEHVTQEKDAEEYKDQLKKIDADRDAKLATAAADAAKLPESVAAKAKADADLAQVDKGGVGFAPANPVDVQKRKDKINDELAANAERIRKSYEAQLHEEHDKAVQAMETDVQQRVEKRYGTKVFDQAVANNALGAVIENPTPQNAAPAEPPKPTT